MRRFTLRPKTFFKLFVAATAFGLGLFAAGLWPRRAASPAPPHAAPAPSRAAVSVRDTFADEAEEADAVFEGRYENHVYGYSVAIPTGMVGAGLTPRWGTAGFVIDLDHPNSTAWLGRKDAPESYVSVAGGYNSLQWERLDEAVNDQMSFLRDKVKVRVQSMATTRLAGLRAVRVVARYEKGGEVRVSDFLVALRRWGGGGEVSVVYTLDMDTPQSKYERDRPVLEALMKGWCLQPVE